ncbi:MAG TPA: alpha-amylase/4-alpha-glucanotransferase domain-containing protein [Candidatus Limnocylindria bacterium]|nr:alpha-amylase/4-alpha-glucanotransferase domain-containing protein [Candidatus Limnocylindria bacterium]
MAGRISLALVLHNHQPVGNFGWVIEEVFRQAYEPMVGALERHPQVRLGLHYSGPLLEWLESEQPAFLDRLRALTDRGQVELLGGAHYEPVLVALPERDRQGQLAHMRSEMARLFGRQPDGAWLAERVWEPSLPADLARAGYRYTVLDDNHLRGASVAEDAMWGTYTTDDQGRLVTIFGTEKGLRYRIPFRPVAELVDYLRAAADGGGQRLGTMGDDGEKFGAWPGTYEHCWGKGRWVDECFEALIANSRWLTTVTPSEWLDRQPPIGRIYVPTSSYVEMTQWALPAGEATAFDAALAQAEASGSPAMRFLRGGMWRNFQARYREINDLHKQMLRASALVDAMPAGPARDAATEHLYRGQSNDCYWHGLFGGIYLCHMRLATLAELIAAEDIALGDRGATGVADHDLDGVDEVLIGTGGQTVLVDPAEGGGIGSWDLRASRHALASVMRRRPEAYHAQLRRMEQSAAEGRAVEGKTATSIHEQLLAKEGGLSALLAYDEHERRSGLVRVLVDGSPVGDFDRAGWSVEEATDSAVWLRREVDQLTLRKGIVLAGDRSESELGLEVELANAGARQLDAGLEVEWNINLLGGGGNPAAFYRVDGRGSRHDAAGSAPAGAALAFGNDHVGASVSVAAEPPAPAEWYPVETVSNSEAGFERVYQGSCLVFRWPLQLGAGQRATFRLDFTVAQSGDLAASPDQPAGATQRDQRKAGA